MINVIRSARSLSWIDQIHTTKMTSKWKWLKKLTLANQLTKLPSFVTFVKRLLSFNSLYTKKEHSTRSTGWSAVTIAKKNLNKRKRLLAIMKAVMVHTNMSHTSTKWWALIYQKNVKIVESKCLLAVFIAKLKRLWSITSGRNRLKMTSWKTNLFVEIVGTSKRW